LPTKMKNMTTRFRYPVTFLKSLGPLQEDAAARWSRKPRNRNFPYLTMVFLDEKSVLGWTYEVVDARPEIPLETNNISMVIWLSVAPPIV
jgi:hypothetical protein